MGCASLLPMYFWRHCATGDITYNCEVVAGRKPSEERDDRGLDTSAISDLYYEC